MKDRITEGEYIWKRYLEKFKTPAKVLRFIFGGTVRFKIFREIVAIESKDMGQVSVMDAKTGRWCEMNYTYQEICGRLAEHPDEDSEVLDVIYSRNEDNHDGHISAWGFVPKALREKWECEGRDADKEMVASRLGFVYLPPEDQFVAKLSADEFVNIDIEGEVPPNFCPECFALVLDYIKQWYSTSDNDEADKMFDRLHAQYEQLKPYYTIDKKGGGYPTPSGMN